MILLTNDDGLAAPAFRALYRALRRTCRAPVLAVAPDIERSGAGQSISLRRGLRVEPRLEPGFFGFAVDGTPADCAKLALTALCQTPPRLVVSGINDGPNVGRSIHYSGTLGAALEAAVSGCPALAASRALGGEPDWEGCAAAVAGVAARMLGRGEFAGKVVNCNLPAAPPAAWREMRIAQHGDGGFVETFRPTADGQDGIRWRLHGEWVADGGGEDVELLSAGHPVLSLLQPGRNAGPAALRRLLGAG